MKKILLFLFILPFCTTAQVVSTVADGDFYNPLIWSDFSVPADGDSLMILHDVNMNFGIPYTAGSITVAVGGKLSDGGTDKDVYINGGQLINHGILDFDGLWLDSGYFANYGSVTLDSLLTQDDCINEGTILVFDFLHDQNATFSTTGDIWVTNNFNNQGVFELNAIMTVDNDASNCNIQSSNATLLLNGWLCVANDFLNCATDTIRGSGTLFIGGASTNAGEVQGTLTVNDLSSGAFDLNTGTIEGTVSFGTAVCGIGFEEEESIDWTIYPNPATEIVYSSLPDVEYKVYEMTGRLLEEGKSITGEIPVQHLPKGLYMIKLINTDGQIKTNRIEKL